MGFHLLRPHVSSGDGELLHSHPNIDVQVQDCCNHINITRILQDDLEIGFIILPDMPNPGLEFLPLEKETYGASL